MDNAFLDRVDADPAYDGPIDGVPYAEFLGLRLRRDGGRLTIYLPFDDKLIGSPAPKRLHGGVTGAALEFAGMVQLAADARRDGIALADLPKPVGLTVDYLRAGKPQPLFASAQVERRGRRIANVRAVAWQDAEDEPIAVGIQHFLMPE